VINESCVIGNRVQIILGNCVVLAPQTYVHTASHIVNYPSFGFSALEIRTRNCVYWGLRSVILISVTIGKDAIVAAKSVVTKSVDEYAIVGSVPANKIGDRTKHLNYTPVGRPLFR
jgi:maltose O-acetyltransferase